MIPTISTNRSRVLLAVLAATLLCFAVPDTVRSSELSTLVETYLEAKGEWTQAKNQRGRRGGRGRAGGGPAGGGPGGRPGGRGRQPGGGVGRRDRGPSLEPILVEIAELNSSASLKFLAREYRDPEVEIQILCAVAMLASDAKSAAKHVVRGFDRGGRWSYGGKARVLDALAADDRDGAIHFVIKMATRGKADMRALAVTSLRLRANDPKVRDAILKSLDHRSAPVRNAALRALAKVRDTKAIGALLERLDDEKDERLRADVLRRLVQLTGQNMGFAVADWQKWWAATEPTFEFGQGQTGKTVPITPDLTYFGIEVASKRVAFLVDASKSMDGGGGQRGGRRGPGRRGGGQGGGGQGGGGQGGGKTKLAQMKDELTRILKKLPDDSLVNIIPFHRRPLPWKKELHPLRGDGRQEAITFVRNLTTELMTNIYDTLELALDDKRVDTIFILTDGRPVGGKYDNPADILREIGGLNRVRGAKIHCISFGRETEFLKRLAAQNGGDYRAAD